MTAVDTKVNAPLLFRLQHQGAKLVRARVVFGHALPDDLAFAAVSVIIVVHVGYIFGDEGGENAAVRVYWRGNIPLPPFLCQREGGKGMGAKEWAEKIR